MKETTTRNQHNRREFIIGGLNILLVIAAFITWRKNSDILKTERTIDTDEIGKAIGKLLQDLLQSDEDYALQLLSATSQEDFIELITQSRDVLLSPEEEIHSKARYELISYVLKEYYRDHNSTRISEQYSLVYEDSVSILNAAIAVINTELLTTKLPAIQAAFWIEAVLRAYAAALGHDATILEGVTLPSPQSRFRRTLFPKRQFISLRPTD